MNEALYRQTEAVSHPQTPGPHGGLSTTPVSVVDNTEGPKQSRRFLECVDDNFPMEEKEEATRILDLVFSSGRSWWER